MGKVTETIEEAHERGYLAGQRRLYIDQLMAALRGLGFVIECGPVVESDELRRQIGCLAAERAEAVAVLREVCSRHGDNNWKDNLHLHDVIEKHLQKHLEAPDE